jgi:hypothetical protein
MVKGHLDQARKNQRSTKTPVEPVDQHDEFPSILTGVRSHYCYASIMEPTGQIYTNQTGRFVQPSSNGNNYLLI